MKKNLKNGFTLIELLAVIIILAIVAVIATPIVLNVVDDAKSSARDSKLKMYADSIKLKATEGYLTSGGNIDGEIDTSTINNSSTSCDKSYYVSGKIYLGNCIVDGVSGLYYVDGTKEETKPSNWDDLIAGVVTSKTIIDYAKELVYENNVCKTDGTTYTYMDGCYIKGLPTTNYVWYSGFMYRIMGINSDGTVRLITEENVTAIPWGAANTANNYTDSHVRDWLNSYFLSNLKGTDIIANGNFCFGSATTTATSNTTCTGTTFNDKAGLISIDEYNLAGAGSSYLKNAQFFWTMTPYSASNAWSVYYYGYSDYYGVTGTYGVRAVINVNSTTTITAGDGTLNSYYVLNETKNNTINTTLASANISSGEYVKFAGKNYRVVSVNGTNVKMILDGYYTSNLAYGTSGTPTCTLCTNSDVFNWLVAGDANYASKLVSTTWYQGAYFVSGNDYANNLSSTANPYTGYIGLIRVGEMLSGQSETILNPTRIANGNSYSNAKSYWTATPYSASSAWSVYSGGYSIDDVVTATGGVRAVINANSANTISGGNGTPTSPYEI